MTEVVKNLEQDFDSKLDQLFGTNPAKAVMEQPKVIVDVPPSAFSLTAPPVVKDAPKTDTKPESPFINEEKTVSTDIQVTTDGIDWSTEADDLVDLADTIQTSVFSIIAQADSEERELFQFSSKVKKKLGRVMTPVAKKYNIQVGPEFNAIISLAEVLIVNGQLAMEMRKEKAEARKKEIQANRAQIKVVRDEETPPQPKDTTTDTKDNQ